jgi:mRNA interferase MazF
MPNVKQGEIWYANLNPTKGSEQAGHRPVVIVSGNMLNQLINTVIVFPLTTKSKNYKGNLVLIPNKRNGLAEKSEVLTFHIRSLSKVRLTKRVGVITQQELEALKQGLDDLLRY